jgi:hypothetical protein
VTGENSIATHQHCGRPGRVAGHAGTLVSALERHEATTNQRLTI